MKRVDDESGDSRSGPVIASTASRTRFSFGNCCSDSDAWAGDIVCICSTAYNGGAMPPVNMLCMIDACTQFSARSRQCINIHTMILAEKICGYGLIYDVVDGIVYGETYILHYDSG